MSRRVPNIVLYVGIAVCIVGAAVAAPLLVPERFLDNRIWFTFIGATGFLWFFVAKMYWHKRKSLRLWELLAVLCIVHIVGFSVLLRHVQQFPDAWFLLIVPVEIIATAAIVKVCLNVLPQRVSL